MSRSIGLVLGGGGGPGWSYLVGTLAGLADATGWDPRQADLIVGTSAGAGVGALLRCGLSASDQFATQTGREPSPEGRAIGARAEGIEWSNAPDPPTSRAPGDPVLMVSALRFWPPKPGVVLAGALPKGTRSTLGLGKRITAFAGGQRWPSEPYWAIAVRSKTGRREVLGGGELTTDLGTAVAASSAVPGVFAPVVIDGNEFVDGAMWSSANADVAAGLGLDGVLVIAPMSVKDKPGLRLDSAEMQRRYHRGVLRRQAVTLRRGGSTPHLIEPDARLVDLLNEADLDPARRGALTEAAYDAAKERARYDDRLSQALQAAAESQTLP